MFNISENDTSVTFKLRGYPNPFNMPVLKAEIEKAALSPAAQDIVIDLEDVEEIDISCISCFLRINALLARKEAKLILLGISEKLRPILRLMNLDSVFVMR